MFPWPTPPDELRARWEDQPRADWDIERQGNGVDTLMIADMLVPLTHDEARERCETFGLNPEYVDLCANSPGYDRLYTCRNWDEETRKCTVYDARPDMCATYPYGDSCMHCGYAGGSKQQSGWRKRQGRAEFLRLEHVGERLPESPGSVAVNGEDAVDG